MKSIVQLLIEYYSENRFFMHFGIVDDSKIPASNLIPFILTCFILRQVDNLGKDHILNKEILVKLEEFAKNGYITEIKLANLSNDFKVENNQNKDILNPWKLDEFIRVDKCTPVKRGIFGDLLLSSETNAIQYKQELIGFGVLGNDVNYFTPISIFLFLRELTHNNPGKEFIETIRLIVEYCAEEIRKGKVFGTQQLTASYLIWLSAINREKQYLERY